MEGIITNSTTFGVVISLLAYGLGALLKEKTGIALCNPLLIAIVCVIAFLAAFGISYDEYNISARYLSYLLTPATVALAIPLYKQMHLLKSNLVAILISILSGVLTSMACILALSMIFHLNHPFYVTLLPKSITTAIGMGVAEELGGIPTIAVAVIILTGIQGNIMGAWICKIARIRHAVSKGLAIGTASHAIGTARAMQMGEIEGAMSSLSIVVAGLMTVLLASFFAEFIF